MRGEEMSNEDKIKLIQSLIDDVNELQIDDWKAFDDIKFRTNMIFTNLFGEDTRYRNELSSISASIYNSISTEKWIVGTNKTIRLFKTIIEEFETFGASSKNNKKQAVNSEISNKIFIVHGHDNEMKEAVARMLGKIGLEPIILHEQADKSRTIIEKFTDYSDVGFAIVLFSPDDFAHEKNDSSKDKKARPRQNVIFELGFFIGKLGIERVRVLCREPEKLEIPSDYFGVLYKSYDSGGSWENEIVKELKACKYDVDANKLF